MRDFRKSLCQILHNFMDKIKNMLCCCYQRANDNISSEIVNGVFLVTKQQRDQKSPYMKKLSKHNTTFFPSSRSASKLSNISTLENRSNVVKSESNLPPPITKLLIENAPSDQGNCNGHNQKPRTLSSRYRSNPELTLSYEELDKQRNSFAENEECGGSDLVVPAIWRTSSFIESEKHQRATLTNIGVEAVKTCQGDDNIAIKSRSKCAALKNGNAEKPEDSPTIRTCKTPRDHDLDKSKIKDVWRDDRNESVDGNSINTGGSNHQYTSDFTLGIDFSDFS
uniref:uncharacterized protein LOC120326398 n=1 Tax=Styela clava TaxID=7725 RepID=UPI0019394300|nr:uncharacterized protein LOC120326398 [Styela clava]